MFTTIVARRRVAALSSAAAPVLAAGVLAAVALAAPAQAALPTAVTVAGSFQSEVGCSGDWQPDCATTHLTAGADGVWRATFALPAGSFTYKAAIDDAWTESYGGAGISLNLPAATSVTFYYDPVTHWITDNVNSVIVTAAGDFQSELGCAGDWDPSCLRSWLQDPDGNGVYTRTTELPPGTYAAKAAIDESWDESYGAGGVPGAAGLSIPFTVPAGATVLFSYDSTSHLLTITVRVDSTPTPASTRTPTPSGTGAAATTSDSGLPATGTSTVAPLAIAGTLTAAIGVVLLVVARRRRDIA